jgi:hypothetical protein
MSKINLPRPGHHGNDVRDAFQAANEADDHEQLYRLAGRLWSCTDIMPGWDCEHLDLPRGSTYAQAARLIRSR